VPEVKCAHPDKTLLRLSQIIDTPHLTYKTSSGEETLPYVNQKTRAQVRVVDFYPPNLADFTQCLDHSSYNDCPSTTDDLTGFDFDDSSLLPTRWEWSFYLLVEDAKPMAGQKTRMPLLIAGSDAEYLLRRDAVEYVILGFLSQYLGLFLIVLASKTTRAISSVLKRNSFCCGVTSRN
jgi:protection-of-telomeres protein 1